MKIVRCALVLAFCVCLSGCSILSGGSHIYVEQHQPDFSTGSAQNVNAKDYDELYQALSAMVEKGQTQQIISVDRYGKEQLEKDLKKVTEDVRATNPIAAYAVDTISCTIGTSGGMESLSVEITYVHDKSEIRKIIVVADNSAARDAIAESLNACDAGVVMYIEDYEDTDFTQMVEDYAFAYPEYVMEQPQVTVSIYPESGASRVVEMKFSYNTSRESLKNMQNQVSPVFRSAVLYVSGDAAEEEKFSQLHAFLTERYEYIIEPSITPAYSLLRHGVGDCRAFATVFAAMCRQAGLECFVVTGTRTGSSWYWNIVSIDGVYYHLDLLVSSDLGGFSIWGDNQIREGGYLWDFDAYPACPQDVVEPAPEIPVEPPEENIEN